MVFRTVRDPRAGERRGLFYDANQGALTASQLLARYCTWVYARTDSSEAAARQLGISWRTVKRG